MKIVALAGGVGGAKLVDGLAQLLRPEDLTVVVNTGDDFEYMGLYICPDLDTVCYMSAGFANPKTGWGCQNDTFQVLENIQKLGGPVWFKIGDKDLATHLERTRRLHEGEVLSDVTQAFCRAWGVKHLILPMSDQPVRTMVDTKEEGELPFQEYFVHQNCTPIVKGFRFSGIDSAIPSPGVLEAIEKANAIVLCPSNPWVSIDPILSLKGLKTALFKKAVLAVSPIIDGKAVKGPVAKMFTDLGFQPSALAVALHYENLLSGFILDNVDKEFAKLLPIPVTAAKTIMKTREDRRNLAQNVLNSIIALQK
jgi:LPPG:FO 2-phospho-L-lactate transferase